MHAQGGVVRAVVPRLPACRLSHLAVTRLARSSQAGHSPAQTRSQAASAVPCGRRRRSSSNSRSSCRPGTWASSRPSAMGAAYRNRTDDLRITRRITVVHGCPGSHVCPARLASQSARVRDSPGSLLANPLAQSIPAAAPDDSRPGSAAPGQPRRAARPARVRPRVRAIQCVPECRWMRSSASGRWPGRGSAAVMARVPVRRVAMVRLWATTGASALRSLTCRAS